MIYLEDDHDTGSSKSHALLDESIPADPIPDPFVQNLFVLRHGETMNNPEKLTGSDRPWDPSLTDKGKLQAWRVGRHFRVEEWNITRVVMSPFLRCVQTAVEVIAGLRSLPSSVDQLQAKDNSSSPNNSTIKASIECGLAEMMHRQGLSYPPDNTYKNSSSSTWILDLAELYSMLPVEIHDTSFQPTRETLPLLKESMEDIQDRYTSTFQNIASKFHNENILCITHGEGVVQSVSMMWPRVEVYGVSHCAHVHAQRPNFMRDNGFTILSGEWELLTESGSESGISFYPSP